MKLDFISVKEFKNLRDFTFDFDERSTGLVTILLGQNGSGKSNLLEALVVIFRDLYLGSQTPFAYELRYTLEAGATRISIVNSPEHQGLGRFKFSVSRTGRSQNVTLSQLRSGTGHVWLPRHIFAYYSGPSDRLEEHFHEHQ